MEEKQETPESDQEELDFDWDALDRWQDDGGPAVFPAVCGPSSEYPVGN